MMRLTEALVVGRRGRSRCAAPWRSTQGETLDFTPPFRAAVDARCRERARRGHRGTIDDARARAARLERLGIAVRPGMSAGGLLDELFSELVQPTLRQPTFVVDYPVEISPLAARSGATPARSRALRAVRRGQGARQRVLRAERSRSTSASASRPRPAAEAGRRGSASRWTRLRARAGVRHAARRAAAASASTGWRCCSPIRASIRDVILFPTLRPEEEGS